MGNITKAERIEKLIREIGRANGAYYRGEPIMADYDFDKLINELKEIAPKHPYLKKVGAPPDSSKATLERTEDGVMGSLNKSSTPEALLKWFQKYPANRYVFSPKIDGLAGEVVYRDHEIKGVYTRGDGITGEDVTKAGLEIESDIPHFIECSALWVIRGEFYFDKQDFKKLNEKMEQLGQPLYKHPRNVAVGLINSNRAYHPEAPELKLKFRIWKVMKGDKKLSSYEFESERVSYAVRHLNMRCVPMWQYMPNGEICDLHILQLLDQWTQFRKTTGMPLDGIVCSLDNTSDLKKQGGDSNGTPHAMTAYKFPPMRKKTVVKNIIWQMGRTGRLCPVVQFEPVILDGSEVTNATGDNAHELARLGVAVGRTIMVEKGGDIIPQIVGSIGEQDVRVRVPVHCPVCQAVLEEHGKNIFCRNKLCPAQIHGRIENFCKVFDMLGFGPSAIADIAPKMKSLADMFKFNRAELGIMLKSNVKGAKLYNELHAILSHQQKFSLVLEALGIHGVGKETAKKIASAFKTPKELVECTAPMQISLLLESANVGISGDVTLKKLPNNLFHMIGELIKLMEVIEIVPDKNPKAKQRVLEGKTFLITGTLSKPRKYFESLIESNGGTLASSVNKSLNYLLFGEGGVEAKRVKAKSVGAVEMTENALMEMIEGG